MGKRVSHPQVSANRKFVEAGYLSCVKGGVVLCAVVLCLSVSVVCVCAQVYQLSELSSLAARGAQPAQPVGVWVEFLEGHAKFAGN